MGRTSEPIDVKGSPIVSRAYGILICFLLTSFGPWVPSLQAQVEGRIRRVGLFEGAIPLVRSGNWTFVQVDLRCLDSKPFDGMLRAEQIDCDGDVDLSVLDVPLAPDGQWRPFELYFVPNSFSSGDRLRVKLYDSEGLLVKIRTDTGEEVTELVSDPYSELSSEELLIVDLTTPKKLPHVAWLDARRSGKGDGTVNLRAVRFLSPQELPTRWQGLESVDAIVWDDADPSVLTRQQVAAVIDWVNAGGRLLITSGKNWQNLVNSPLASVLPVTITGASQKTEAQEFSDEIVKDNNYMITLEKHYANNPILKCDMVALSNRTDVVGIPAEDPGVERIAYRRLLGRGSLTFVGASLRQLLPVPKGLVRSNDEAGRILDDESAEDFIRVSNKVIGRNFLALPKVRLDETGPFVEIHNLFDNARKTIGFQTVSAAFLVFAILFAVAYCLIATVGTYWYLKRRAWEHLCWSAFAIVSLVGIVIGTGMVWTLRGVTTKLWQTTVIDAKAGDDYAHASCMLGVKTHDHTRLDLRLPLGVEHDTGQRSFGLLRVMPRSTSATFDEAKYVAPDKYQSARGGDLLRGVPVRATLKEFQGFWQGALQGTLDARFVVDEDKRFGSGSYIRNRLGVTLRECFILEGREEVAGAGTGAATSLNCLYLGELPADGPEADLDAAALYERLYVMEDPTRGPEDPPKLYPGRSLLLTTFMQQWRGDLPGFGNLARTGTGASNVPRLRARGEYASMLLLSVFDLLENNPSNNRQVLRRSHGRSMGCTHQITPRTAILIGFSEEPSPVVLEVNRTNLLPEKSLTLYRFVIPVERP
ncbi:MAG: hypothetical protein MI923_06715 [Phycisphaerales bacterium]|nr:hypothetical protein [Phycisphaerales bacterium]